MLEVQRHIHEPVTAPLREVDGVDRAGIELAVETRDSRGASLRLGLGDPCGIRPVQIDPPDRKPEEVAVPDELVPGLHRCCEVILRRHHPGMLAQRAMRPPSGRCGAGVTVRNMRITPDYDAPSRIRFDGDVDAIAVPVARQRRRFELMLTGLDEEQWYSASRCEGWTVRDVVAHLVGVNRFWVLSVRAGLDGAPTRYLETFDPVAVPRSMVEATRALTPGDILQQFVESNAGLLDAFSDLDTDGWSTLAESPVGHVPLWSLAHHALWDAWVHERDVALPLDLRPAIEPDEVAACLRYVAVIGSALVTTEARVLGEYGVEATDPDVLLHARGRRHDRRVLHSTAPDRAVPARSRRRPGRSAEHPPAASARSTNRMARARQGPCDRLRGATRKLTPP